MAKQADTSAVKNALATQERAVASEGLTIAQYLDRQKPAIMAALPRNVDVDRFARIVLTTVRQSPKLLACSPISLLAAVMQAAQLGLEPGNGLNEAHIVPYGGEATFQMGYRGAVKLATNSAEVRQIWAEAVYKGEQFNVIFGTDPKIEHVPVFGPKRGQFAEVESVYAVARLTNGETQFTVMGHDEILAHKERYSKGSKSKDSPWNDSLGAVEMAKKTVVLRLSKLLPLTAEAHRAFAADGVVRHELVADMVLEPGIPDDGEVLDAADIGAVAIEQEKQERGSAPLAPKPQAEVQATLKESATVRLLRCQNAKCGNQNDVSPDATLSDLEDVRCGVCGGAMEVVTQ